MESIKDQTGFDRVFEEGIRRNGKLLSIIFKDSKVFRIGIIVNKKYGNAVRRNRIKRLIKEACRNLLTENAAPIDLIIIPRSLAAKAGAREISMEISSLLSQNTR